MSGRLANEVAIVTGAGRGFGRSIALRFAQEGARIALVSRSIEQLREVAAEIGDMGGRAIALAGDVTSREDVNRIVSETETALGIVTLMVNNAGTPGPFGPIGVVDPDEWWASQSVHQRGPLLFISRVIPAMIALGGGRIINISATASVVVAPSLSAYCVGKAAQNRLAEHVHAENYANGIRIFALQPGMAVTALAEETANSPDVQKWLPGMAGRIAALRGTEKGVRDLDRCANVCADMAAGRFDIMSGRYFDVENDFEALLAEAEATRTTS